VTEDGSTFRAEVGDRRARCCRLASTFFVRRLRNLPLFAPAAATTTFLLVGKLEALAKIVSVTSSPSRSRSDDGADAEDDFLFLFAMVRAREEGRYFPNSYGGVGCC